MSTIVPNDDVAERMRALRDAAREASFVIDRWRRRIRR